MTAMSAINVAAFEACARGPSPDRFASATRDAGGKADIEQPDHAAYTVTACSPVQFRNSSDG